MSYNYPLYWKQKGIILGSYFWVLTGRLGLFNPKCKLFSIIPLTFIEVVRIIMRKTRTLGSIVSDVSNTELSLREGPSEAPSYMYILPGWARLQFGNHLYTLTKINTIQFTWSTGPSKVIANMIEIIPIFMENYSTKVHNTSSLDFYRSVF